MNKNTSISLGQHFSEFVDRQVDDGRYSSASEVIRAGLRLLEEHELQVAQLRAAIIEGEESGPSAPLNIEHFLGRMRAGHGR
jgi:antitoxin ParD1/3/4